MKLVYVCDYCSARFLEKEQAEQHEKECKRNPANKTCYTCKNFIDDIPQLPQCRKSGFILYASSPNKECWEDVQQHTLRFKES